MHIILLCIYNLYYNKITNIIQRLTIFNTTNNNKIKTNMKIEKLI